MQHDIYFAGRAKMCAQCKCHWLPAQMTDQHQITLMQHPWVGC